MIMRKSSLGRDYSMSILMVVLLLTLLLLSATTTSAVMVVKETRYAAGDASCTGEPLRVLYEAPGQSNFFTYGTDDESSGNSEINCDDTQELQVYNDFRLGPTTRPDRVMDLSDGPCITDESFGVDVDNGAGVKMECVNLGPTDFFVLRTFLVGECTTADVEIGSVYSPRVGLTGVCVSTSAFGSITTGHQLATCSTVGKLTLSTWQTSDNCTGTPDSVEEYMPNVCNVGSGALASCGAFFPSSDQQADDGGSSAAVSHTMTSLLVCSFLFLTTPYIMGN